MKQSREAPAPTPAELDYQEWRGRALYLVLIVVAVGGLPSYVSIIVNALLESRFTPILWIYSGVYAAFVLLAFMPRIGITPRAWIFFTLAYVNAVASFARVGLAGSGRLYLAFIPAAAVILVGARSGYFCLAISLAIYTVFTLLARAGILAGWLTEPSNPLDLGFWIEAGAALSVFMILLTVLVERFSTRHMRTLDTSHRVAAELAHASEALEKRVQERTRELKLLNSVAAVVSGLVNLGDILRVALERTMEAFAIETGEAYGLQEETGMLVMLAHKGLSEEFVARTANLPLQTALAGKQLSLEEPLSWDVDEYPRGALRESIEAEGLKRIIGVPLVAKGKLVGGLVMNSRSDRSLAPEEGSLLLAIGQQIGLAIENARLLDLERIGREDANRRREVAEGLRETLAVLNSNSPLSQTIDFLVTQACTIMGSDAASLERIESPGGSLRVHASCGLDPAYVASIQMPLGRGGAGRALAGRQPLVIGDCASAVEEMKAAGGPGMPREITELERLACQGFRAVLSVPLVVQNEDYGAITLYYHAPRQFGDEEVKQATTLAHQAALAIENAGLRAQGEEAAALAERNRLARELHDSVTQSLYSITLYAEAAARHLQGGQTAEAAEHMRELGTTARESLREMRLLIFELSPPALEKRSLVDALQTRLDAVESRGGMRVSFRTEGVEKLTPTVRQELFQIAQEALNNALKHSRAPAVEVRLLFGETETRLEIRDEGIGFDVEQARRGGGHGLQGLGERVERIGGRLSLESSPGEGAHVTVTAPCGEARRPR